MVSFVTNSKIPENVWRSAMSTYYKMIRREPGQAWQAVCSEVLRLSSSAEKGKSPTAADIVMRLRAPHYWMSGSDEGHEGENDSPFQAADEIHRLRETIEVALLQLADGHRILATETLARAVAWEPITRAFTSEPSPEK